jgi:hypothetical protein
VGQIQLNYYGSFIDCASFKSKNFSFIAPDMSERERERECVCVCVQLEYFVFCYIGKEYALFVSFYV